MNPYGISSKPDRHAVYTEIRDLYRQTEKSRREYDRHHFADARLAGPVDMEILPTCAITTWYVVAGSNRHGSWPYTHESVCGQPATRSGLCTKHAADKARLGGVA